MQTATLESVQAEFQHWRRHRPYPRSPIPSVLREKAPLRYRHLSSGLVRPSTIPKYNLNGAQSLQPEGLRPIISLSTLDRAGYPDLPKTRYRVRWVPASRAGTCSRQQYGASWRTTS